MTSLDHVNNNLGLFSLIEAQSSWILLALALVVSSLARGLPSKAHEGGLMGHFGPNKTLEVFK